jgi:SAM-dependent MidA family methyltransferase
MISLENIIADACKEKGSVSYYQFIEMALYHPKLGYYVSSRKRVGHQKEADFYTASSLGGVFSHLVIDSIRSLLKDESLEQFHFVEIGAENGKGIMDSAANNPFASAHSISIVDRTHEFSSPCILFSNELFDAQPFCRFKYLDGQGWVELGVKSENGILVECVLDIFSEIGNLIKARLPEVQTNGYVIDFPIGAEFLLNNLLSKMSSGLFIAFDYGKSWRSLAYECPQGTSRTYNNHKLGNDLLVNPGAQDITHHVCWEFLEDILKENGFQDVMTLRQESFFMRYSQNEIARIMNRSGDGLMGDKSTLMELLHPGNMGAKFQVMFGLKK